MDLLRVDDPADERLADYRGLTDVALRRRLEPENGLYMAESGKVLSRALAAGHTPRSIMTAEKWLGEIERILAEHPRTADVPVYLVPDAVAEGVTGYTVHRGMLAAMHRPVLPEVGELLRAVGAGRGEKMLHDAAGRRESVPERPEVHGSPSETAADRGSGHVPERSRIAVLEGLVDHTNVGAVFRSAAAMGVDAVLVTPTCADPLYRRSIRVSMGTVFQIPWTRIEDWPGGLQTLRETGYIVAGMTLGEGSISLEDLVMEDHQRLALVFGAEGHGITPRTDRALDRRVTIPMAGGVDSLNAAAASAVAFYATR